MFREARYFNSLPGLYPIHECEGSNRFTSMVTGALVDEVVEEPAPETVARLVRALLLKSLVEILILCLVLSIAGFKYFNPMIRGEIVQADAVSVRGWVANPLAPRDPIQLQLVIDGRLTAIMIAQEVQPEHAVSALLRRGEHPFQFSFQRLPAGPHSVQVYAVQTTPGRTLSLVPITRRSQTFTLNPAR
jgi:hypothetical protein